MAVSLISPDSQRPTFYTRASDIPRNVVKRDLSARSLEELYYAQHPSAEKGKTDEHEVRTFISLRERNCSWLYLPWRGVALRIPNEETYFYLRTARNRNLITEAEQRAYREAKVGIAGLSVGSSVLLSIVATGGPKRIKMADPDSVEITNLNRMRANLFDVGENKTDVAARAVWEIDPFAELELWQEGISADSLDDFMAGLDVFIDEMDDITLKFAAREACRSAGIPVLMATDNGDGVILDVERFDVEPEHPIFHGRVPALRKSPDAKDRREFVKLSNAIIDISNFTKRQHASILAVGTALAGIPQLGTAAVLAGAAVAYAVRQIAIGAPLPSGRYVMSCEQAFARDAAAV